MNLLYNQPIKISISNILIVISFIFTLLAIIYPVLFLFWLNTIFLSDWLYHIYLVQFFTSQFLHSWMLHFFMNALFLYLFWNIVEYIIWRRKYIVFFIFVAVFIWIWLTLVNIWNTVWISWFCMALLSYYTLELKSNNDIEYKWWITALIINILIWFHPDISLFGHLLWAIAWVIFYLGNHKLLKKLVYS